jgi:hypothetical protein
MASFDILKMCADFHSLRVRKLTGKPAFLTIADSESEAPRIQFIDYLDCVPEPARKQRLPYPVRIGLATGACRLFGLLGFWRRKSRRKLFPSPILPAKCRFADSF